MSYKVTEEGNVSTVFLNGEIDMDVTEKAKEVILPLVEAGKAMSDFKNSFDSSGDGVANSSSATLGQVSITDDGSTVTIKTCFEDGCASDVVSTNTVAIE